MLFALTSLATAQVAPPIVNGEETSDYPAVGALVALANNGSGFDFCSGTLVHERWVITAAHCVEAFSDIERKGYGNFYFILGTDIYASNSSGIDEVLPIVEWHAHPDYNTNNLSYDIGILELGQNAGADPMPINDNVPNNWDEMTYVGWGITGDSSADYYSSGVKRTVDVPFYYQTYYHIHTYDDTGAGRNICSGDSGGAMLYPENGMMMLVGANSFGYNVNGGQPNCEGNGSASAATRVDTSLDWLETFVTLYRTEDLEGSGDGGSDDGGSGDGGSDDGGSGDGGSGDGGSGDGGSGDGGSDDGGSDGNIDTAADYDTASATLDEPDRPTPDLAGKGCNNLPGGFAGLGTTLMLALGLIRRREDLR